MTRARRLAFLLLFTAIAPACGGFGRATDPQVSIANAAQRLRGEWLLVDFRSREQLEPMLASLLNAQFRQLTVTITEHDLVATGVGVSARRTYTVREATDDQFSATLTDPSGSSYDIGGLFQGRRLAFVSRTSPWAGEGQLERVQ